MKYKVIDVVVTEELFFLDREEAMIHAQACGQIKLCLAGQYNGNQLFSEDLW